MAEYVVHVIIENKPGISDPEGDTILNDLILKGSFSNVTKVRSAQMLKFTVKAKDKNTAKSQVQKICDDLRIYNPMVSKISLNIES